MDTVCMTWSDTGGGKGAFWALPFVLDRYWLLAV